MEYLYYDFGSAWRKTDTEGHVNLAKEAHAHWLESERHLYDDYAKKLPINSPERGHLTYLCHDGNRDAGLILHYFKLYEREGASENFPVRNNSFDVNLWRAYCNLICWIRHVEIYLKWKGE